MPALATLVDDFDDGVIGAAWTGNYGVYSETGGRARVQCDPNYGAFVSGAVYTLTGSSGFVRMFPPAAGGATTSVYAQFSLVHSVAGTEIGVRINVLTGKMRFQSNVDYFDAAGVEVTYDPVAHAYARISEAGGTLSWATSPDGSSWTTQRTLATPAWVTASTTVQARLETYRNNGTVDYAEFDNFNTVPVVPGPGDSKKGAAFLAFF